MEHRYIIVGDYSDADPGTFELPFKAKNAAEFDRIMRKLADPPNAGMALHIHIGPGIYKTLGLRHFATTVPGTGGHGPGVSQEGDRGWFVRPDWTITGAGAGATVIQLDAWPSYDGVALGDTSTWTVVGCSDFFPVSNVTIEHLTVDGNWPNLNVNLLPPQSPPTDVALHGLFCQINGSIVYGNVTVTGVYGLASAQTEGFALGCSWSDVYGKRFIDPQEVNSANRAHFESCTIHGGFGDFCVGIAAVHGGPAIISGCTIYSLTNLHSGAIRLMGKDILITNCFIWNCLRAIYADTGNIIDLTVQNSRFLSTGPGPVFADSTLKADGNAVWINVRQDHVEVSGQPASPDMDGVYVDVPIRPIGGQNPLYRIRLYLVKTGSTKQPPAAPASGVLIPCPFTPVAEAGGIFRAQKSALEAAFVSGLAAYQASHPHLVTASAAQGVVRLDPVTTPAPGTERIYHSQGAPFTSDESKVYIQAGWSWSSWRFRNCYFELPFIASNVPGAPTEQSFIHIVGNGSSDKNHHYSNNLGRFTGEFPTPSIPNYSLRMKGIDGVTVMDNAFDADAGKTYGKGEFIKAESPPPPNQITIDTLTKRGNRNLYEKPIQTLLDDFHDWGSQQTLSANNGYPLPGAIVFSDPATGVLTGTGVDLRDELRPGDLLATDNLGAIGAPAQLPPLTPLPALNATGPFYVKTVNSTTGVVTLNRGVVSDFANRALLPMRRYRGPIAYLSNPPPPVGSPQVINPLFNVMNDGSVAIGGIPATFGTSGLEFYVNGRATITEQLRASNGSAAAPAVSFTADTGTGFFRPLADAVGLVTSGVERARVTSAGWQLGNAMSLGFGTSTSSSDTFVVRDDAANRLALRNGTSAQTFRVYENYGSSVNYARLSFNAQPAGYPGSYQIRSEAGGTGTLRSLQVGTGPKSGTNQPGLDTFLHAGQGTGTATGGAIPFSVCARGECRVIGEWLANGVADREHGPSDGGRRREDDQVGYFLERPSHQSHEQQQPRSANPPGGRQQRGRAALPAVRGTEDRDDLYAERERE